MVRARLPHRTAIEAEGNRLIQIVDAQTGDILDLTRRLEESLERDRQWPAEMQAEHERFEPEMRDLTDASTGGDKKPGP